MLAQQIVNGIMLGSTYALIAISYTLIMGILDKLNFAVGEVFMLGAYLSMTFITAGLPLWAAVLLGMLGAGLLSLVVERVSFRPFRNAPPLIPLVSTIGFSFLFQNVAENLWSSEKIPFPETFEIRTYAFGSIFVTSVQLLILGLSVLLIVLLDLFIQRTRMGRGMRAVAESEETACILGVDSNRVNVASFFISGVLAGASGILFALRFFLIWPQMSIDTALKGIAAMVIGGLGSVRGAIVGGLILGLTEVMSVAYLSASYRDVFIYSLLFAALVLRPQGILGVPTAAHRRV
ncbi:MAG: branched-chain amino acid ABC transporter permease [Nitrospinota bacterium]